MGTHSGGGDPAAQEVADAALQPLVECGTRGVQHAPIKELAPGTIGKVTLKEELRRRGATGDHTKAWKTLGAAVTLAEPCDPLWPTQTSGCSLRLHHRGGLPRLGRRWEENARLCPPGANLGTLQTHELVPSPA